MIYVIHAVGTPFVKIGISTRRRNRLKELQIGCPFPLAYLAVAEWPNSDEIRIHRVLRAHRAKGEWFKRCPEIESLIKHMQSASTCLAWLDERTPRRLAKVLKLAR